MANVSPKIPYPPLEDSFTDAEKDYIKAAFENYNNNEKKENKPAKRVKLNKKTIKKIEIISPGYSHCLECGDEIAFERQLCGKFYCKNDEY